MNRLLCRRLWAPGRSPWAMWSFFCSALCLKKRHLCGKQTSPFIKNSKVIELVGDLTIWFNEPLFKRTVHPATSPQPSAGIIRKVWTAIVPDEPYRAKGLCREGNFPLTPCTFATAPHTTLISSTICFLSSYCHLRKNISLALLQPHKLGFRLRQLAVFAQ